MATDTAPSKRINDGDDLNFFLSTTAYSDIRSWLRQLNHACFPTKDGPDIAVCRLDQPPPYSDAINELRSMISQFSELILQAPPDTGPRRFGNVAFRAWYKLAEQIVERLLDQHVAPILREHGDMKDELKAYLLGSFGSAQRLDYGTGHELSFLAFLGCLSKLGAFAEGEERAIVVGVFQPYCRPLTWRNDFANSGQLPRAYTQHHHDLHAGACRLTWRLGSRRPQFPAICLRLRATRSTHVTQPTYTSTRITRHGARTCDYHLETNRR